MAILSQTLAALLGELLDNENNIVKLLVSYLSSVNDIENVLYILLTERNIYTASLGGDITDSDAPLRIIGRVVNQPYNGQDTETYRRLCRARISVNKSTGVAEDLIGVAELIIFLAGATYTVTNEGTATVRLTVGGIAITDTLAAQLFAFESHAVSAGVRIIIQWGDDVPGNLFEFDAGPGWDQGELSGALSN